jgi:hypothetical protein
MKLTHQTCKLELRVARACGIRSQGSTRLPNPSCGDEFSAVIGSTLVASCKYLLLLLRQWELTGGKWAGGLVDQLVNSTIYVHASIKG